MDSVLAAFLMPAGSWAFLGVHQGSCRVAEKPLPRTHRICAFGARNNQSGCAVKRETWVQESFHSNLRCMYCPRNSVYMGSTEPACLPLPLELVCSGKAKTVDVPVWIPAKCRSSVPGSMQGMLRLKSRTGGDAGTNWFYLSCISKIPRLWNVRARAPPSVGL